MTQNQTDRMTQLKSIGKKVIRRFVQPPWRADLMEFKHGVWQGVSPLFTESGRQLGEENARPFLFNDHIPAKTLACKYDGSRNGHLINMSALRVAMTNYDPAVEITKDVIRHHASAAQAQRPAAACGIWDLYIIALASISLISYSVRRRPTLNASAIIPDDLASQYQFIAGIFMICRHMIDSDSPFIAANDPISAAQLYEYADQHEIFTSFNGMVCAGSTKKIMDFLELCTLEMQGAFAAEQPEHAPGTALLQIVDDADQWYRYALAAIELDCFVKIARRQHRIKSDPASTQAHSTSLETYQKISAHCALFTPAADHPHASEYENGVLSRQNKILSLLGRKPIAKIDQRLLTEQLGYD